MKNTVMEGGKGKIVLQGLKTHRSLLRSIECQLEKWIKREQSGSRLLSQAEYRIEIDRESEFPFFLCTIQIQVGTREWTARESGKTIQEAIDMALRHLQPQSNCLNQVGGALWFRRAS